MIIDHQPTDTTEPGWFPLSRVAEDLLLPVETVRMEAATDLNLNVYDPERDAVTQAGRQQIRDILRP